MSFELTMSTILAQAVPNQPSPLSWILGPSTSLSGLLVLACGIVLFGGACYLIASKQRPALLASYLVLLPIPTFISLFAFLKGIIASLGIIAASPNFSLTTPDFAAALVPALLSVFLAMLVTIPTYCVIAFGLLYRSFKIEYATQVSI